MIMIVINIAGICGSDGNGPFYSINIFPARPNFRSAAGLYSRNVTFVKANDMDVLISPGKLARVLLQSPRVYK
jgi:hypothetical protein